MKIHLYSRWDGSLGELSLDAERALGLVSELLLEGLELGEALERLRREGFALVDLELPVMGLEEMIDALRREIEALHERYGMDGALDGLRRRLEAILAREEEALRRRHGFESARLNDFLERRHPPSSSPSETLERLREHEFEDEEAGAEFEALLRELDALRGLERFLRERAGRFRGAEQAGYETAQRVRARIEALEQLARALAEGQFELIDPETLGELLGTQAARSLVILRDLEQGLRRAGYLRAGGAGPELTPRAIRRLGASALAQVYGALRKGRGGRHETASRGAALPRPDETRPFAFGDPLDLDVARTLLAAVRRRARQPAGAAHGLPIELEIEDFEVCERDFTTSTTTVLLLDMSWSMSWAGRFPAAKRVALALDHLVRTRFPRDHFFVVGFSTRARELRIGELPEARWDVGDPFTNLQEGLMLAERLIAKHPSPSPQILVVTDGQPTAYFVRGELRVEWPMGLGGVSPRAAEETLRQVRRVTGRGITINTFMLDRAPELVGFVERLTRVNRGRAFFTSPSELGSFLMVDYLSRRRTLRQR